MEGWKSDEPRTRSPGTERVPDLRGPDPVPEALIPGRAEETAREALQLAGYGDKVIDFLFSALKAEWSEESRQPDHECTFFEQPYACDTCGIPYSEWVKLDNS